ncbi:MAG: hypothetical protein U0R64_01945 [Candidatus Nanopelagicales bacterium]
MFRTGASLALVVTLAVAGTGPAEAAVAPTTTSTATAATAITAAAGSAKQGGDSRNSVKRAGLAPQWVQLPHLVKSRGHYRVKARAYVDPLATQAGKRKRDRVIYQVLVGKRKFTRVTRPTSPTVLPDSALLQHTDRVVRVKRRGVYSLNVRLNRSTTRSLAHRSFPGRRAAIAVTVEHHKDTRPGTKPRDLVQVTPGPLAPKAYDRQTQRQLARNARHQRHPGRTTRHRGLGYVEGTHDVEATKSKTNSGEPFFNYIYVHNNTPFQQQVNFQPDVQCMWVGISTAYQIQPNAQKATVPAGGSVMFDYQGYWDAFPGLNTTSDTYQPPVYSPYPGVAGATKGMDAPGTQGQQATALSQAANAAGQNVVDNLGSGSTYVDSGAIGATAAAAVRFTIAFFKGLGKTSTCTDTSVYPQTFGLTTSVTGIGTNAVNNAANATLPPTQNWAGNPAAGNQGSSATPDSTFLQASLQQALGAQTSAMYYWNGGQPAYMVSNNASSGQFTGGSASFTGGLIQYIGPNPGLPDGVSECTPSSTNCQKKYPKCNMACSYDPPGQLSIQLSYLTNPDFVSGMVNQGDPPQLTATADSDGDYELSCDLSDMDAALYTPFGESAPTSISSTTLATQPTNGSGTLPANADWLVNFYGIAANGDYVYYDSSLQPGSNGVTTPYLAPNAASQPISIQAAATGGSGAVAQGLVSADDLSNMATLSGTPTVPVTFGCNATPSVDLPGVSINRPGTDIGNAYGSNWPMPTGKQGWPTSSFTGSNAGALNWQYMTPVTSVNVQFRGFALGDTTPVPSN